MKRNSGVSEIIGSVLLVALVMLGMGIVGVMLFSSPPPDSLVKASLSAGYCRCPAAGPFIIFVSHNGGDPLRSQDIYYHVITALHDPDRRDDDDIQIPPNDHIRIYNGPINDCAAINEGIQFDPANPEQMISSGQMIKIIIDNPAPNGIHIHDGSGKPVLYTFWNNPVLDGCSI